MDIVLPKERLSDILNLPVRVVTSRIERGVYHIDNDGLVKLKSVKDSPIIREILQYSPPPPLPSHNLTVGESFAGAGGFSLGFEAAGYKTKFLVEFDKHASNTLRLNRPNWNVIEKNINDVDFSSYLHHVDVIAGGFPCQPFSTSGKELGFRDTRGTLFHEFARSILETQPKAFVAENVTGLLTHDKGRTLDTICRALSEIGYTLLKPKALKAMLHRVPQKRERLFIIGFRQDLASNINYIWPSPNAFPILTVKDALKKGVLYNCDVPASVSARYPDKKHNVLQHVPEGGNWRNLPPELQISYMGGALNTPGGKTSFGRRLEWNAPSNTLTCSPSQKQTERCHPSETRPLTTREYARIQTFPDNWMFSGSTTNIYKQIGNAVPVNLASAIASSLAVAIA